MTFQKPIPVHKPLQTKRLREREREREVRRGKNGKGMCFWGTERRHWHVTGLMGSSVKHKLILAA